MKKVVLMFSLFFLQLWVFRVTANGSDWENISREYRNVRSILINSGDGKVIFAGSKNSIISSEDSGFSWRRVYSISENYTVNYLVNNPDDANCIYAASDNGLYFSSNSGLRWRRLFRGKSFLESRCNVVLILPEAIYLGTNGGLFSSNDKGRSWFKQPGILGDSRILNISSDNKQYVYVSSTEGLFRLSKAKNLWEKIFDCSVLSDSENEGSSINEIESEDEAREQSSQFESLSINPGNGNEIYFSCKKGVYRSIDSGDTWDALSEYGLLDKNVRNTIFLQDLGLCAATKSGVFLYKDNRWWELSVCYEVNDVRCLAFDKLKNLYIGGNNGVFKIYTATFAKQEVINSRLATYIQDEPKVSDVQQAAVKYAEVNPEKIKEWRRLAAKKAFLPKVSAGVNNDTSDLWHWETGSSTKVCDDVLMRGKTTIGWDVALSWDLSEIIWSEAQTSIDTRSRLSVQLRNDILDEVNKTYFERLRLKAELDNLKIEDSGKLFEKEVKIRELTATLDGLTGGYFSACLKDKS
ncbi:MAG: hypothetical protein PHO70_02705 [Candidatus Omnitrophica bacterium]|nr:hypothetical protein [Candidatus Omnitrophota bacterium]